MDQQIDGGKRMVTLGSLLIISDRYPHAKNAISSSFVKDQVDCIKNEFDKIIVIALTPRIPKFLSGFSLINPRWARDADAYDYKYDNVSVYFAKYFTLPFNYVRKQRGRVALEVTNKIITAYNVEFDLIHAHFIYPSGYVGMALAQKYNKKFIIIGHGYDVYDLPFRDSQWNRQVRGILDASDHIITPSQSNYRMLAKLGAPAEKISLIPNGYNSTLFIEEDVTYVRKKLNLPEEEKIILAVGHLESVKGHEYLIQAMEKLASRGILCIILGEGSLEKKLEKLICKLNLEKYVRLVGARSHDEIPFWMNACDVFVLPSINESFGIVQIEAMACGKPVVATRNGGSEEIIINDKLGILVEPKDPEGLAQAILQALETEWDAAYIREYAQQFTWERIAERIGEVYHEVLKSQ